VRAQNRPRPSAALVGEQDPPHHASKVAPSSLSAPASEMGDVAALWSPFESPIPLRTGLPVQSICLRFSKYNKCLSVLNLSEFETNPQQLLWIGENRIRNSIIRE
jgi:hypothetical protein